MLIATYFKMVTCMGHRAKMEDMPCMLLACLGRAKGVHGACIGHAGQLDLSVDGLCTLLKFKRVGYIGYKSVKTARTYLILGACMGVQGRAQGVYKACTTHTKIMQKMYIVCAHSPHS